jgi:hypothetical protein
MESDRKKTEKYSPKNLLASFKLLISNMMESIKTHGYNSWYLLLMLPLILFVIILHIISLIKLTCKVIKKFGLIFLGELNFYWSKFKDYAKKLSEYVKIAYERLIKYITFKIDKLFSNKKDVVFQCNNNISTFDLVFRILVHLFINLIWFLFMTVMSLFLLFGFFGFPYIHRIIRIKIFKTTTVDDDIEKKYETTTVILEQ